MIEEEIELHTERLVLLKDMLMRKQKRVPCKKNQHYLVHIVTSCGGYVKVDGKEYLGGHQEATCDICGKHIICNYGGTEQQEVSANSIWEHGRRK